MEKKYKLKLPLAMEFRHKSWFEPEILDLLRKYNIANVIGSGPGRWPEDRTVTADLNYVRFHGTRWLYASSYTRKQLDEWSDFIKQHKVKTVFAYFNNDKSAKAISNAKYLQQKLK